MSIQDIRDRSGGVVTKFIVGLIIVVFALFGMGSITTFLAPVPKVATVNGEDITTQEMQVELERNRRIMLSRNRDPNSIDEDVLRQSVLQTLITRKLLTQAADEMGLQFSNTSLDADILATPVFQIDGVYDPSQFQLVIGSAGYSPVTYRNEIRRDKLFTQLDTGIRGTSFFTNEEVARTSSLAQQTRDIAYLRVDVAALSETVDVSTEEVESYYQAHQSDFMTEETVDIAYIELKRDDFLDTVEVSEEALLSFFEETSESYAEPERRRVAHILIEINDDVSEESARQKIDEIHARITTSGEGFDALAKEFSNDPGSAENGGDLGFNDLGTFVEEFEAVSNILTMNQLSAPVKTEFGYHLIKLLDLEAAKQAVFAEVREKVEAEFRELGAEEIFVNKSSRLSEISYESPDLVGPSEELELELKTMGKVARTGSNTGVANNQAVTDALFSPDVLFDGNNSNLLEITPNHHIVVRVTAHQPREVKALETVAEVVSADIALEKSAELAETQAQEMVAMLEDGSITRFVADQYGLVWTVVADATRTQPGLDREINRQAFGLPRPEEGNKSVGYAILSNGDSAVISVTNVNNKNDVTRQELSNFARALASQQGAIDYSEFRDNLTASGSVNTL